MTISTRCRSLRQGRDFAATDFADNAPLVGIVNDAMVRQYFRTRIRWASEALGAQSGGGVDHHYGVAGDVNTLVSIARATGALFALRRPRAWKRWSSLVRTQSDAAQAWPQQVKQQIWKADPQLPITLVKMMNEVAEGSFAARRFYMLLLLCSQAWPWCWPQWASMADVVCRDAAPRRLASAWRWERAA